MILFLCFRSQVAYFARALFFDISHGCFFVRAAVALLFEQSALSGALAQIEHGIRLEQTHVIIWRCQGGLKISGDG